MEFKLVATKYVDHGPGPPYYPCMKTHVIMQSSERVQGKQFFTAIDTAWTWAKTWLSDEEAQQMLDDGSWNLTSENSVSPPLSEK
jgi:hypothetical protein